MLQSTTAIIVRSTVVASVFGFVKRRTMELFSVLQIKTYKQQPQKIDTTTKTKTKKPPMREVF